MHRLTLGLVAFALALIAAGCASPAPTPTATARPSAVPTAVSQQPTQAPTQATPPAAAAQTAGRLAELGQAVFDRSCNSCHGAGFAPAPALWIQSFSNAQELYNFARTRMPTSGPGSLKPEEYFQVVAWELVGYQIVPADAVLDVNRLADISLSK
jgi:cytochrome c5